MIKLLEFYQTERIKLYTEITDSVADINFTIVDCDLIKERFELLKNISKQYGFLYTLIHKKIVPIESKPKSYVNIETISEIVWMNSNVFAIDGSNLAIQKMFQVKKINQSAYSNPDLIYQILMCLNQLFESQNENLVRVQDDF